MISPWKTGSTRSILHHLTGENNESFVINSRFSIRHSFFPHSDLTAGQLVSRDGTNNRPSLCFMGFPGYRNYILIIYSEICAHIFFWEQTWKYIFCLLFFLFKFVMCLFLLVQWVTSYCTSFKKVLLSTSRLNINLSTVWIYFLPYR